MGIHLQDIVILIIILLLIVIVIRKMVKDRRNGMGSCKGCNGNCGLCCECKKETTKHNK